MTFGGQAIGMALFGSRARGDHVAASDVDVLLWTEGGHPEALTRSAIALSVYPREMLLDLAAKGDLFVAHLVTEAVAIWDPLDLLGELRRAYTPNLNLEGVIANATDIGRLLLDRVRHFPPDLFNKRAAWVARTIMIARAAQAGGLVFSARRLSKDLGSLEGMALVDAKDSRDLRAEGPLLLKRFLEQLGCLSEEDADNESFRARFARTGNTFGTKTLNQLESLEPQTVYA